MQAGVAYASRALPHLAAMSLLVVLSPEPAEGEPLPASLQQSIDAAGVAGVTVLGRAGCHTLVQRTQALAPSMVLVHLDATEPQLDALLDALAPWGGAPPCALGVMSAPLDGAQHAALVAAGVHGWGPIEGADALAALTAQAQARWTREAALRTELYALRTRMDERKWVDRAKGLLMSARGIGEDEAFGLLRGAAMHANLRLGEVSRSVIEAAQWAEAINRASHAACTSPSACTPAGPSSRAVR